MIRAEQPSEQQLESRKPSKTPLIPVKVNKEYVVNVNIHVPN